MWYSNRRGRTRGRKEGMNNLEKEYAAELENQKIAGEIKLYLFEPIRFVLADRTTYQPDFMVVDNQDYIVFFEVKGFWEEDARVKIKVAAKMFPFAFIAVQKKAKKDGGGWMYEEF